MKFAGDLNINCSRYLNLLTRARFENHHTTQYQIGNFPYVAANALVIGTGMDSASMHLHLYAYELLNNREGDMEIVPLQIS